MANESETFSQVRARLEEIVGQVRSKEISLEKSLDLFDEAIKLGNNCFELIDSVEFSPEELRDVSGLEINAAPVTEESVVKESKESESDTEELVAGNEASDQDTNSEAESFGEDVNDAGFDSE